MIKQYLTSYVEDLAANLRQIDADKLATIVNLLLTTREADRQIFIIGDGASASAASHMACDLAEETVNYADENFKRFRALSLTDNTALITAAVGNDISSEDTFVEQLKNDLNEGDVVIAITASGNSPNIVRGLEFAQSKGAKTVGILGFGGGKCGQMADISLVVPSRNSGIVEDFHLISEHLMTQVIRRRLAAAPEKVAFLDRDGIINENAPDHAYIQRWEDFKFRDGAVDLLKSLSNKGYRLVVITNQQGIGKGLMTSEDLDEIHANMCGQLYDQGVKIDGVFHCPHLAESDCSCRKPKPGLIYQSINEQNFEVDFAQSLFIGDSISDVEAGLAAGLRTILVTNDEVNDAVYDKSRATQKVTELEAVAAIT